MKTIGERISYKTHSDYSTIIISTKIDKWKETLLLTWLLGWTVCGVGFIYYLFFGELPKDQKLVLAVVSIFWLFFELRIGKAFLWRKFGQEFIKIDKDLMSIKKSVRSYGKAVQYQLGRVKHVKALDQNPKGFNKVMNDSFWVIGQGTVNFEYNNEDIRLGTQLEKADAEKLAKVIRKLIIQYNKEGKEVLQKQSIES